jgi:AraC-like DNA-binding protein
LGKIAADLDLAVTRRIAAGAPGRAAGTPVAHGAGWSVEDVVCTAGPADRPFEEQHSAVSIGLVVAGSFQYRSAAGRVLMTPGSVLLGNPGHCFECGHDHASGDRCIAFRYAPDFFAQVAADAGATRPDRFFQVTRLPPRRELAALVARASEGVSVAPKVSWEELAIQLAARAIQLGMEQRPAPGDPPQGAVARVTRSVRDIERQPAGPFGLRQLASDAGLSPFHYLRTFLHLAGVTPHQFVLRTRLRQAAARLAGEDTKVIEIALGSGFGDLSNFNRSFRSEFGVSPRDYRTNARKG